MKLLNRYCDKVLGGGALKPKTIHGRALTAAEFCVYVKAFASLFSKGAHFPEASTMLEATAAANNTNATAECTQVYKDKMIAVVGPNVSAYVKTNELEQLHSETVDLALELFDRRANFGSARGIEKSKKVVISKINEDWDLLSKLNEGRNPFGGLELVFVPLVIAFASFILRYIADSTCSSWSQTCKASSDLFAEIYTIIFLFLIIVASTKMKQMQEIFGKMKQAFGVFNGGSNESKPTSQIELTNKTD